MQCSASTCHIRYDRRYDTSHSAVQLKGMGVLTRRLTMLTVQAADMPYSTGTLGLEMKGHCYCDYCSDTLLHCYKAIQPSCP